MAKEKIFSITQKRVISAMYQLDRWATANEIADWAEMSWNTAKGALKHLKNRGIVEPKRIKGKVYWKIIEEY